MFNRENLLIFQIIYYLCNDDRCHNSKTNDDNDWTSGFTYQLHTK